MTVTTDPTYVEAAGVGSVTTGACTATPIGGVGPYTYAWGTFGGDPGIAIDSAATAATTFTATVSGTDSLLAYFVCTVTDSGTSAASSSPVAVEIRAN
jgi:hypothetical protein